MRWIKDNVIHDIYTNGGYPVIEIEGNKVYTKDEELLAQHGWTKYVAPVNPNQDEINKLYAQLNGKREALNECDEKIKLANRMLWDLGNLSAALLTDEGIAAKQAAIDASLLDMQIANIKKQIEFLSQ